MNLKIKSSRTARDKENTFGFWDSPAEETNKTNSDLKNDIDMMKLEIVKELRESKN